MSETRLFKWDEIRSVTTENYDPTNNNTTESAYIVVDNKVYDVVDFIADHPGGDVIISLLGKDATDAFEAFHPSSSYEILADYYVGDLAKSEIPKSSSQSAFAQEIRTLMQDFRKQGLFDASLPYYAFKLFTNISILASSLALLYYYHSSWTGIIVSATLMAMFWAQCGWLAHDFLHHQVFKNRSYNNAVGYILGNVFQGFSVAWWKSKHNIHHAAPNVHDTDPDIDTMPFLALSEGHLSHTTFTNSPQNSLTRFVINNQAYLFYPICMFARLSWALQSLIYSFVGRATPNGPVAKRIPNAWVERITMLLHFTWYNAVIIALITTIAKTESLDLALTKSLTFFLVNQAMAGLFLATVFSLNHNGMPILTEEEMFEMDFYKQQVVTGRDVVSNVFTDFFTGGLNYQIEHHLFPMIPRHNFHKIQPIVQKVCEKHGVPYHRTGFVQGSLEILNKLASVMVVSRKSGKI